MREGFARGWAEVCGPARLVFHRRLLREIDRLDRRPAVFTTTFDLAHTSPDTVRRLRDVDLFVWIGVHPKIADRVMQELKHLDANEFNMMRLSYPNILEAGPRFVWNALGVAGMEFIKPWRDEGLRWETIHPAADTKRYYPDPDRQRFGHVEMAYVGGYWAEKAQAFDIYLRPWEDRLWTYGYARWPYKHYGGKIDEASERKLYSTAKIIPLVTTPFGWRMAEMTERYFKLPACGGFGIADQNPALREVFREDEMLQARDAEHFHELVRDALADRIDRAAWAARGLKAVQERHLYRHRALQIRDALAAANSSKK